MKKFTSTAQVERLRFGKSIIGLAVIGCFSLLAFSGCNSEPAIAKANVKLVGGLKTAIGAKKPEWLEAAAKKIEENHQHGTLSEPEYNALEPIVGDARRGKWADAEAKLDRLIAGQHGP